MGNCLHYRLQLVPPSPNHMTFPVSVTCFSYKSLKKATNNFATVIRMNGFSISYMGTLIDGSRVVVKVYDNPRFSHVKFASMIEIMSSVRHQNFVQLIGYCIEGDQKMLVHDFLGGHSLDQYLFSDFKVEGADLDWHQRVSICQSLARALDYLHNGVYPCVVLRDIKPSKIFIDSSFNPKFVDFEVARIFEEGESDRHAQTAGTRGYVDPECFHSGRYSEKTDVYAFGMTILEIINGRHNVNFLDSQATSLADWAWKLQRSGRIPEIVDPTISEISEVEVIRFVRAALTCVQLDSELRPSISEVRLMLSDGYDLRNLSLTRPANMTTQRYYQWCSNEPRDFNLPESVVCFSFQSLENATNHFRNKLGSNGFSSSYIGSLDDGSKIVVKVYDTFASINFISMIKIMSGLKHQNVVELIGYCLEDDHHMLVHEFVGDYTLDQILFSSSNVEEVDLNWEKRMSICHGIACSLEYLHNGVSPCVVLRDVKPGNVFVDSSFNPKIVDFEVAYAYLHDEDEFNQSGPTVGTFRYLDPEYAFTKRFSKKTDIYAFGITLLEIISGRKNMQFQGDYEINLVHRARSRIKHENRGFPKIVDPILSEFSEHEVKHIVSVALSCVQLRSELRPNMSEVRQLLSVGNPISNMELPRPWPTQQSISDNEIEVDDIDWELLLE